MRHRLPPRSVNVTKLADARAPEVEAFYSIIQKRVKLRKRKREEDAQDFTVPRSQRRRTTSYLNRKVNLWKKRKRDALTRFNRFKTKTAEENGHDNDAEKLRKLCRCVRRRIELKGGSVGGFGYSRDGTARLVMHVWHAKRFKMIKKWGYYLPLGFFGRGRGSRAVLKWSKSRALLHDASYFSAVQLEGPEGSLLNVLRMVLEPAPPSVAAMSEMQKAELCGVCYGTAMLNKVGESPHGSIAPVTYLWCPSASNMHKETTNTDLKDGCAINSDGKDENNPTRYLWIWIHAAAFDDAFNTLQSACQRQIEKDGIQLMCLPRRGELGRLDVLGAKALQLLQKILYPISWPRDPAKGFQFEDSLDCIGLSTSQISQLSEAYLLAHADMLPNNAVLSMQVYDPRDTPAKQCKYLPRVSSVTHDDQTQWNPSVVSNIGESGGTNADIQTLGKNENEENVNLSGGKFTFTMSKEEIQNARNSHAIHIENKTLWDSQSKGLFVDPPLTEHLLSQKRHQQRVAFFHLDDHLNEEGLGSVTLEKYQEGFSRSCPILLLKNDNKSSSACGWSIILPIRWVRAFWIPLVLGGAQVIGLRERRWLSIDAGLPSFPYDFPDCKAYEDHMNDEAAAYEEMIALRPPSKSPPSIFIPPPWYCIQRVAAQTGCNGGVNKLVNTTEAESGILASENECAFGSGGSAQNKFEIREKKRNTDSVGCDLSPSQNTYSHFPGFIARTAAILRQHLRGINGLHLLIFPETYIGGKLSYFCLMEKGRLAWSLKGSNAVIADFKPCFLRVLLYAPRKGAVEEGAIVCAPTVNDFTSYCSRSQGWQGLEIPPTLRNAECRQQWRDNREIMQSADMASTCGKENLRMPIGFVTTGVCRGSVPAVALAFCEGTILGQLRAEQWNETKWKKNSQIFVLVRNMKSTVYRPALAAIVMEEIQDTVYW